VGRKFLFQFGAMIDDNESARKSIFAKSSLAFSSFLAMNASPHPRRESNIPKTGHNTANPVIQIQSGQNQLSAMVNHQSV
jgi:hypothetical protein